MARGTKSGTAVFGAGGRPIKSARASAGVFQRGVMNKFQRVRGAVGRKTRAVFGA